MEDPTLDQVMPEVDCDHMESWSRLLTGPVDAWREEPKEQVWWQDL